MGDLATFRLRVQEIYRRARLYDDRRPTQKDLADAIGLSYFELSNRLNNTKGARLSQRDIRAIIRTLADWGAISTQAEALELLAQIDCPPFSAAEWQAPPLDALVPLSETASLPAPDVPRAATPPNNLPEELTSFVGRQEIAAVAELLVDNRLVTITGTGGIGKTRFAMQVAAAVLPTYRDGVWLVELAPLGDGHLVVPTVLAALDLRQKADQALPATLINNLQSKRLLLILDNCEHLIGACAELAVTLLRACPELTILATSREPLFSTGETIWPLPPLHLPGDRADPSELSRNEAVRLFVARGAAVLPGFGLTVENAPLIADICRRLDGIPLAIELAAARVRGLSVEQIAARLNDRFRLLSQGARTALPRQQTLRALVDWSYDLLTADEQTLLTRLAVFVGGWELAAAEAVASDEHQQDRLGHIDVLDGLLQLVNKSLVIVEQRGSTLRYSMLETIRQYALMKLTPADELVARRRSANYFAELSLTASQELRSVDQAAWLTRLETEHDNLRMMLDWTLVHQPAQALHVTANLWLFWYMRGYLSEGRQRLARALDNDQSMDESLRARALNGAGALASAQGDYAAAQASYEQCLAIRRRLGERRLLAGTLHNLGNLLMEQTECDAARALFDESRAIYEEFGNPHGIAISLTSSANLATMQGDYETAWALNLQALAIDRDVNDQQDIAVSLNNLGEVALLRGDYAAAAQFLQESLDIRRQLGDPARIASSLGYLGRLALIQADYTSAEAYLAESLMLRHDLGDSRGQALALTTLAELRLAVAEYADALECYRAALTILQHLADRSARMTAIEGCGRLALSMGDLARAARLLGASAALREAINVPLPRHEQQLHDAALALLRAELSAEALAQLWAEGQALSFEQVVQHALMAEQPVASGETRSSADRARSV